MKLNLRGNLKSKTIVLKTASVMIAGVLCLAGCSIHTQKDETGHESKADIRTPFGGLKVRTDDVKASDTGIPVYPNAQIKPRQGSDDSKADVNIDTPFFAMKVVAISYTSSDSPDKILGFYRDRMKSFGKYIECKDTGSKHDHDKDKHGDLDKPVSCDSGAQVKLEGSGVGESGTIELKAGTNGNQHLVSVKPARSGTEFSLVYIRMRGGKEDSI